MKAFKIAAVLAVLTVAACSDDDDNEASAEFTGDGCVYSGPTEFEVGDEFEITVSDVTEERMDVGFAVWRVPDGPLSPRSASRESSSLLKKRTRPPRSCSPR